MKRLKTCTITHHTVPNYGAVLQAYALQKTLDSLGFVNEILDYDSERVKYLYHLKYNKNGSLKNKIGFCVTYCIYSKKNKLFKRFADKYIKVSSVTYNKSNLKDSEQLYDLFITGSDQVWNLKIHQGDTAYMLDFISDSKKKGSYAASFGYESIPDKYKADTKKYLSTFSYINVRETTGKNILTNDLCLNNEVSVVLDPTLLLGKKEWLKLASVNNPHGDYILIYDLINSSELIAFACQLSRITHCKLIVINHQFKKRKHCKNLYFVSPENFISLFHHAKYVITSSFHGVAFSLILHKQFYYQLNKAKQNNNSRITDLINKLDLENRFIGTTDLTKSLDSIDYKTVNEKLDIQIKQSSAALIDMLSSVKAEDDS